MRNRIAVVIPVYNEENIIKKSVEDIAKTLDCCSVDYHFVIVDDGSTDSTWEKIKKLSLKYHITAIKLSRNFGKESALCAALEKVSCDACIVIDADLQHPPNIIPQMINYWKNDGFDVIEGKKKTRGKEHFIYKFFALLFYSLLKKSSGLDLNSASDFKLLDNKVIKAWRTMPEKITFFRGMSHWLGFKRKTIEFDVGERKEGNSKWSFIGLSKLAISAITSFSSAPLYIVTFLGFIFLFCAVILGIQTIYMKFKGAAVGFTTVILLLLIIGSIIMICMGIIGIYIAKIYEEVKGRPRYIIDETIDNNN